MPTAAAPTPPPPSDVHVAWGDRPWAVNLPGPDRERPSPLYRRSERTLQRIVATVPDFAYGPGPYEVHRGGGLWVKDDSGWTMVRNLAGMIWPAQFCADPARVDMLRVNARRLYAAYPEAVDELEIRHLLDTPITDAVGVARWVDSICNASVPLRHDLHRGELPTGVGYDHYPTPIVDITLIKRDDFELWSSDDRSANAPTGIAARIQRGHHPWRLRIPNHLPRADSEDYLASRAQMRAIVDTTPGLFYGNGRVQCHHGGGLWLKDQQGWFLVRNLAGIEWSAQFCADPAKVDRLRVNARRIYDRFPDAVEELDIRRLLDTPIVNAAGVAHWVDSICNASVPLPRWLHNGSLPDAGGMHHYPEGIASIALTMQRSFVLWVSEGLTRRQLAIRARSRTGRDIVEETVPPGIASGTVLPLPRRTGGDRSTRGRSLG